MEWFNVRAELLGGQSAETYETLHDEMYKKGFYRVIKADDGTWYDLPTATYFKESQLTIDQIYDEVYSIVGGVLKKPFLTSSSAYILIDQYSRAKWLLKQATEKSKMPPGITLPKK